MPRDVPRGATKTGSEFLVGPPPPPPSPPPRFIVDLVGSRARLRVLPLSLKPFGRFRWSLLAPNAARTADFASPNEKSSFASIDEIPSRDADVERKRFHLTRRRNFGSLAGRFCPFAGHVYREISVKQSFHHRRHHGRLAHRDRYHSARDGHALSTIQNHRRDSDTRRETRQFAGREFSHHGYAK